MKALNVDYKRVMEGSIIKGIPKLSNKEEKWSNVSPNLTLYNVKFIHGLGNWKYYFEALSKSGKLFTYFSNFKPEAWEAN
jgi:hypothetical protein